MFSRYQHTRGYSEATISRRRSTLRQFSKFLAPCGLEDAKPADIEEFMATRQCARTRHAVRSDLRVFYRWAHRRQLVASNPAADIEPVKVPKSLPRPIAADVAAALLVGRWRTRLMVALGLYAGLRCAEIAALDVDDVALNLTPVLITVRNGKGGKDRVVPAHPVLADMLLTYAPRSGPMFPNQQGRPIAAGSVSRTVSTQLARVGIHATPHQLRHTFGTEFARRSNGNIVELAAVMGHESTNTTMGYVGWAARSSPIIARMFEPQQIAD